MSIAIGVVFGILALLLKDSLGHQTAAPSPSHAVKIQSFPAGSFWNAIPPKRPCSFGLPE